MYNDQLKIPKSYLTRNDLELFRFDGADSQSEFADFDEEEDVNSLSNGRLTTYGELDDSYVETHRCTSADTANTSEADLVGKWITRIKH